MILKSVKNKIQTSFKPWSILELPNPTITQVCCKVRREIVIEIQRDIIGSIMERLLYGCDYIRIEVEF